MAPANRHDPGALPELIRRSGERFVAGDPLRAVAALLVFCFHVAVYSDAVVPGTSGAFGSGPQRVIGGMNVGVWMFFVLSGYLLSRGFVAEALSGHRVPHVGSFLRNRVLRLVPALWALIVITLVVEGAAGSDLVDIVWVGVFAQVYAPSAFSAQMPQVWTLDTEMVFYLALPLVFLFVLAVARTNRGVMRTAAMLLVAVATLSLLLRAVLADTVTEARLPPMLLFGFVPGMAIALAEPALRDLCSRTQSPPWAWLVGVGAGVLVLAAGLLVPGQYVAVRSGAAALGCGALVLAAVTWQHAGHRTPRVIDNPFLQWLGRRSYSFYLFQVLILHEVAQAIGDRGSAPVRILAVLAIGLALTFATAELGYRFVERPFMRRRTEWR